MKPISQPEPTRAAMMVDGRHLSYLDFGGRGRFLLALHGHFSEGRTFSAGTASQTGDRTSPARAMSTMSPRSSLTSV